MTDFKSMLDKAKEETTKELMNEIKNLSKLTDSEINNVAPNNIDKTRLRDLLLVVNNATKSNEEKKKLIKELADTSDIISNLIDKML